MLRPVGRVVSEAGHATSAQSSACTTLGAHLPRTRPSLLELGLGIGLGLDLGLGLRLGMGLGLRLGLELGGKGLSGLGIELGCIPVLSKG